MTVKLVPSYNLLDRPKMPRVFILSHPIETPQQTPNTFENLTTAVRPTGNIRYDAHRRDTAERCDEQVPVLGLIIDQSILIIVDVKENFAGLFIDPGRFLLDQLSFSKTTRDFVPSRIPQMNEDISHHDLIS